MAKATTKELAALVEQLRAQLSEVSQRLETLESAKPKKAAPAPQAEAPVEVITEEELLAISAAIAAYLGVRAHIRQIRLVSTSAWAQQGRVSIQASHRLQG